jgi:hypothetical protein
MFYNLLNIAHFANTIVTAQDIAGNRSAEMNTITHQSFHIPPDCRMRPHCRIHCRRTQHGAADRQIGCTQQVIGNTGSAFCQYICGCRGDQQQCRIMAQFNMLHIPRCPNISRRTFRPHTSDSASGATSDAAFTVSTGCTSCPSFTRSWPGHTSCKRQSNRIRQK